MAVCARRSKGRRAFSSDPHVQHVPTLNHAFDMVLTHGPALTQQVVEAVGQAQQLGVRQGFRQVDQLGAQGFVGLVRQAVSALLVIRRGQGVAACEMAINDCVK